MPEKYYNQTEQELDVLGKKFGDRTAGIIIAMRHKEYKEHREIPPGRIEIRFESTTGDPGHDEACSICPQEIETLAKGMVVEKTSGSSQKGAMIVRPVSYGQLAHFAALRCVKEGYELDSLDAQLERYGGRFLSEGEALKAIGRRRDETNGKKVIMANDFEVSVEGLDAARLKEFEEYASAIWNENETLKAAKLNGGTAKVSMRLKSYGKLFEMLDGKPIVKMVEEVCMQSRAVTPSD